MYPQFGYGGLFGGGFGGFNPYATFGAYDPYGMYGGYGGMLGNYGGLFGGNSNYDDLFSSFQTKLDDLFKNYQNKLTTPAETNATPPVDTTTTGGKTEAAKPETKPFQFGEKFGTGALSGKGFSQGGINQLKQAGIVSNAQQANEMLKSFQQANAGKDVTQQQFIDYAQKYKPPVQTFTMPGGNTNTTGYAKNPNPAQNNPRYK